MVIRSRTPVFLASMILVATACSGPLMSADDDAPDALPFVDPGVDDDGSSEITTTVPSSRATTDDDEPDSSGSNDTTEIDAPGPGDLQPITPVEPEPQTTGGPSTTADTPSTTSPTSATPSSTAASAPTTATPTPTTATVTATSTTNPPTTKATTTVAPTTTQAPTTTAAPTTTTTASTTTSTSAGPTLVWSDEFNTFNSARWSKEHSTYGDGGQTLQCYTPQQVTVSDGALVLRAEARTETCPNSSPNGSTRDVTSGMVRSKGITFSPGQRIVYRVKLTPNDEANQGGLWPSLWASGWAGGGWPQGGEWDGFEVMTAVDPKRTVFGLHYANSSGNHAKSSQSFFSSSNFSADWHILEFDYGIDGVMTWKMDGQVMTSQTGLDTLQGWPAPFDQAMTELKINLALGGNPGPLDAQALPATYAIDYVRIYDLP